MIEANEAKKIALAQAPAVDARREGVRGAVACARLIAAAGAAAIRVVRPQPMVS
jgi:hypothetical protein